MDGLLNPAAARYPCASVNDLQLQLTELLNTKVSPTKAEHITVTFEIQSTAIFHITESDASDAGQNLYPSLSGLPILPAGQATREIIADDILVNQPQDSPTLQKLVSKHIISAVGSTDQSSWTVREVSRTSSGWTFTYICKDSTQAWVRQNAKNKHRPVVGISSSKDDQDLVNISRPAFDCRGSVTIAFVRSTRIINIRYHHTPLHRTVAQLLEYYAPPAPPAPVPKRQADTGPDASSKKKRKKSQVGDGTTSAEATPTKRRKKASNVAATAEDGSADAAGQVDQTDLVPGLTFASADPTTSATPKPKAKRPRASKKADGGRTSAANKGAELTAGAPADQPAAEHDASQSTQPVPGSSSLNLPPGEAMRRREIALNLLKQNNVAPETLSEEQFNIFANQSPKYQQESLQMLVKYGAERLRVVHPTSSANTPAAANGQTSLTTTIASTDATAIGSAVEKNGASPLGAKSQAKSRAKLRQTRGNCDGCKQRKVKCSRQEPSCSECLGKGLECYYPPPRVRNKSTSAAEIAEDEPDDLTQSIEGQETSDLGSPGFTSQFSGDPSGDLMSPSFDHTEIHPQTSQSLYPTGTNNASHYHTASQSVVPPEPEPEFAQSSSHGPYPYQSQQPSASIYPDPVTATASGSISATVGDERLNSRTSLPSVPRSQKQTDYFTSQDNATSSWQPLPDPVPTSQINRASPVMAQQSTSKPARSRKSAAAPAYEPSQAYNGLQQAAALSRAAVQQPTHQSPVPRNASPFQNSAQSSRAKSRQGHRSQQSTSKSSTSLYSAPTSSNPTTNDGISHYSSTSSQATNQSTDRVAYEPYSQHPSRSTSSSHPSYDNSNQRPQATSSSSLTNPVTQSTSASYSATVLSTNSWNNSTSRNTQSYNSNANSTNASYNLHSTSSQQNSTLQSFHVRPRSTAPQSKTSSSSYNQQPEQQQFYGSYPSQTQTSTNQQQQDWYGFTSANNSTSNNYRSSSRNSGTGGYGQASQNSSYSQQPGHIDGEQALYDFLRGNPGH